MAIGTGWVDGAWVDTGWVTSGDGAWSQVTSTTPDTIDGDTIRSSIRIGVGFCIAFLTLLL
jgi:hypothetical protein